MFAILKSTCMHGNVKQFYIKQHKKMYETVSSWLFLVKKVMPLN